MTRFLHTSDWHLGMTRRFLGEESQARFTQARFEAVRAIGAVAKDEGCRFIVAAGDVFDSNQVERRTVARALEALSAVKVPVYVLPANHDALGAGSVYRSRAFQERRPPALHVVESAEPVEAAPGVDVVGAPWTSRRPGRDLAAEACRAAPPSPGRKRILLAHGAVDALFPDPGNAAAVSLAAVESAVEEGRIHYAALGDRHSRTEVGSTGRVWYSGAPEPTDFDEEDPGGVLVVDLETGRVEPRQVGSWRFAAKAFDLAREEDIGRLQGWLDGLEGKERTVVKLHLSGAINLRLAAALDRVLEGARDVLAAVIDRREGLHVRAQDSDFDDLALTGFARAALERLRTLAGSEEPEGVAARDAMGLLARLARRPR
jgi:DNA repair exonuclease SbcCD nuclease subunit